MYIAKQTHRCRKQTSDYRWGEGGPWATLCRSASLVVAQPRERRESGDTDGVVKMCLWSNISEAKGPGATCQRVRQAEEQTGPDCHLCNSGKRAAAIYRRMDQ